MMKRILSICFMLIAIFLMATPYGVAMTFATSPTESLTKYFPYFSMMPWGYGNWFPIITAFLSIIILVLLIIGFKKANTRRAVQVCLSICIAASLLSWILFRSISVIGVCILAIHLAVRVLQISPNNSSTNENNI